MDVPFQVYSPEYYCAVKILHIFFLVSVCACIGLWMLYVDSLVLYYFHLCIRLCAQPDVVMHSNVVGFLLPFLFLLPCLWKTSWVLIEDCMLSFLRKCFYLL